MQWPRRLYRLARAFYLALWLWQPLNVHLFRRHPELTFEPFELINWRTALDVGKLIWYQEWR